MDQFSLTDEPFARIAPHRPIDTQGKGRVDDRRVIRGIVHVRESGRRGTDAPRDVSGRRRRSTIASCAGRPRGGWVGLFETMAQAGGPPSPVPIDSTAVKALPLRRRG